MKCVFRARGTVVLTLKVHFADDTSVSNIIKAGQ